MNTIVGSCTTKILLEYLCGNLQRRRSFPIGILFNLSFNAVPRHITLDCFPDHTLCRALSNWIQLFTLTCNQLYHFVGHHLLLDFQPLAAILTSAQLHTRTEPDKKTSILERYIFNLFNAVRRHMMLEYCATLPPASMVSSVLRKSHALIILLISVPP